MRILFAGRTHFRIAKQGSPKILGQRGKCPVPPKASCVSASSGVSHHRFPRSQNSRSLKPTLQVVIHSAGNVHARRAQIVPPNGYSKYVIFHEHVRSRRIQQIPVFIDRIPWLPSTLSTCAGRLPANVFFLVRVATRSCANKPPHKAMPTPSQRHTPHAFFGFVRC